MKTSTHSPDCRRNHDKKLDHKVSINLNDSAENKLTEIKAQSPQYSTNVGRVDSKKAGKARSEVAIPALIANLLSLSFNLLPATHNMRFNLPTQLSWWCGGVCKVSGACGRIFGKNGCARRWGGIMYVANH